jgi:hypothetical protein
MAQNLQQNVNKTLFENMSNEIIKYFESKGDCQNIVSEIKNMKYIFPMMDLKEQENIWNNLKKLMESVPKEHFDSEFWINLVFNGYKLEK